MASDWVPLTVALNSLNRSMGLRDLYPFVLTDTALEKLRFVHEVIRAASSAPRERSVEPSEQRSSSAGQESEPGLRAKTKRRRSIKATLSPARRAS
jgi:hypothetical protein